MEDGSEVIELLHNPRDPTEFVRLVELATEPLATGLHHQGSGEEGRGDVQRAVDGEHAQHDHQRQLLQQSCDCPPHPQRWRITVTTAEGGRGHDFRVVDPAIDEKGGLMLILTWVPWSEREWIQFLGRTGRQDHAGQYAVLLNAEDEQVWSGLADRRSDETPAQAILRRADQETARALHGKGEEVEKGRLMHKLTSRYWTLHKLERTSKRQDWEWKRLCATYLGCNTDLIQQTFCTVVVPPKELVLGFAKLNPNTPVRSGLAELKCRSCGTTNLFPAPGAGQPSPTVRCGHCNATSD